MKAITYSRFGNPEVLELREVSEPKVGPGEIQIRVHSTSVNPVDWKIVAGGLDPLMNVDLPAVPGWDVAGVVERVGLDTTEFAVGDQVIAYARKDWVQGGTYAELVTAPARTAAHKPAALDWAQAGALPLAGLTAYQTLTRLGTREGETVLVHAAAGGVGCLAVQIACSLGARVIGTASERNHDFLRELGAEPVTYGDGLAGRVREHAPDGVDVVVDYVGGVLEDTLAVLAEGGRHASIADGSVTERGGHYMWVRPDTADLQALAELADKGRLTVPIDQTFELEQAADAFRASMEGHIRGKIAIHVAD
ncbi:NADP-dependent oxidoreductase [Leekyejoonella antrihumi]|uniref:NADP-dependent oxidoreductase n=1 Tax=Leekyejoonella antrihumi TaxID=1660198 RepID=A0A563E523_9MICO|nr:NADP-dependent oxidoreductase [Leekyejoonella antrihumi]TWP36974.1 NADP-dependent oxidoreductase [Leekyejoonella antrihumi]